MGRGLVRWLGDLVIGVGGKRDREAQERALGVVDEAKRRWDALNPEEREQRLEEGRRVEALREKRREAAAIEAIPFEIVSVPGNDALATLDRLRAAGRGSPVIIGGAGDIAMTAHRQRSLLRGKDKPARVLARAARLKHPDDFLRLQKQAKAQFQAAFGRLQTGDPGHAPLGDWPAGEPTPVVGPSVARDLLGEALDRCHVAMIPTSDGTEAPAHLGFGGASGRPAGEFYVAALRSWRDRFGAELVSLSPDTMECRVARPPATRDAALALAREQYAICPEEVDQGYGSLSMFAAHLLNASWWHLSWSSRMGRLPRAGQRQRGGAQPPG